MKRAYATPMDTPCRKRMKKETEECLKVYCRIRPIQDEPLCVEVISDTSVRLTLQNSNKSGKQYTFKKIFPHCRTQKEVFDEVASPLVKQLIHGENGLLFTYGVTGSGKTYTMMGNKQNVGVMPRCLDALFSSIKDHQAEMFIFKSDKMNGFEVQTKEDAEQDRESYLRRNNMTKRRKDNSQEDLLFTRSKDGTRISIKEDYAYAVFITYVEVYNNLVYDLLDPAFENEFCKKPQSKDIRDDGSGKMYVHGTTEVEVKSTEDALEMLNKGNKRKQMACTTLNVDSSRSHSVFTIKLVQSPLNATGDTIVQEKNMIRVSQLSLVDLAGSERTDRTGNTDQRLYEAGKINQALSVLRKCLETLSSNQQSSAPKMVPYREHKITLLLKNFFQGDGDIRMIACVNPSNENANENAFVMQFAKGAQDIMVKSTSLKTHEPTLEKKIESLEQKLISLERDKKAANAKHEYDTQKIKSLEQKLISFERDKKAANANHEYDTHKVETLKQKLTSLERDVELVNAMHEYDTQKIESLEQKLISLERDTKAANAKHEYDTHKIKTLKQKLTSIQRDVESANARQEYDTEKYNFKTRNNKIDKFAVHSSPQIKMAKVVKKKLKRKHPPPLFGEFTKIVKFLPDLNECLDELDEEDTKGKNAGLVKLSKVVIARAHATTLRLISESYTRLAIDFESEIDSDGVKLDKLTVAAINVAEEKCKTSLNDLKNELKLLTSPINDRTKLSSGKLKFRLDKYVEPEENRFKTVELEDKTTAIRLVLYIPPNNMSEGEIRAAKKEYYDGNTVFTLTDNRRILSSDTIPVWEVTNKCVPKPGSFSQQKGPAKFIVPFENTAVFMYSCREEECKFVSPYRSSVKRHEIKIHNWPVDEQSSDSDECDTPETKEKEKEVRTKSTGSEKDMEEDEIEEEETENEAIEL